MKTFKSSIVLLLITFCLLGCNDNGGDVLASEPVNTDKNNGNTTDNKDEEKNNEEENNEEEEQTEQYPYNILNLQGWKLNAFEGTSPNLTYVDKIPNLETYQNPTWFFSDGEWVSFKCHAGYPTSSGSGNPRTELRERTATGDENIHWDGTQGTNQMEWKVRVDRLPSSGKVCFGQIHGPSATYDDVIRVQFQGKSNQETGSVRLKIMGWVTEDNGDNEGDYIDGNWSMDTEMHFRLIFEDSNVVLYQLDDNNNASEIYRFNGCGSDDNYFKAGIYLQSMQGKSYSATDYGQVSIKYLNVSH